MTEFEAGPELDALIAEKVMGAVRVKACGLHHDCLKDSGRSGWNHASGVMNHKCPSYSTDIAAAWQVVEKFKGVQIVKSLEGDWSVWIYGKAESEYQPTAPLAICQAALGAKP